MGSSSSSAVHIENVELDIFSQTIQPEYSGPKATSSPGGKYKNNCNIDTTDVDHIVNEI